MTEIEQKQADEKGNSGKQWKSIYSLGGAAIFAVLVGNIFSRVTAYLGIAGNALMLVYFALVTFVPGADKSALALAMPGGLLIMAWMVLFALRLFHLAGSPSGK